LGGSSPSSRGKNNNPPRQRERERPRRTNLTTRQPQSSDKTELNAKRKTENRKQLRSQIAAERRAAAYSRSQLKCLQSLLVSLLSLLLLRSHIAVVCCCQSIDKKVRYRLYSYILSPATLSRSLSLCLPLCLGALTKLKQLITLGKGKQSAKLALALLSLLAFRFSQRGCSPNELALK